MVGVPNTQEDYYDHDADMRRAREIATQYSITFRKAFRIVQQESTYHRFVEAYEEYRGTEKENDYKDYNGYQFMTRLIEVRADLGMPSLGHDHLFDD